MSGLFPWSDIIRVKSPAGIEWMRRAIKDGEPIRRNGDYWHVIAERYGLNSFIIVRRSEYMRMRAPKQVRGIPINQIYY